MQWQAPTGGLFTPDDQQYFWQAVQWLMIQAAPLLMILIAVAVAAYVLGFIKDIVTAPKDPERYEYTHDPDGSDEEEEYE
ncbi:MAG: hypothetical protein K6T31_05570 [Alicyclobacillus sp.]|nr:hypothetical protein [Alicyclobacillus sp.]